MFLLNKAKYIIFIFILFLTACSKDDNQVQDIAENKEASTQVIDEDGNLIFSIRQPSTLNPLINQDKNIDAMLNLIFEGLFVLNENLKPVPNLASNYSISEDALTITINMRDDIYWHDGAKITAKDVVYSLDTIKNNPSSIYYNSLDYISSYSSKSNTITIYYKEPFSFALYNLCFPVIPEHYYSKTSNQDSSESLNTLGSGMFKFSRYDIASKIILERTSNFKGVPKISTITAIISTDRETDLNSFEQDITNFITVSTSDLGKFSLDKETEKERVPSNNFEFLGFNLQHNLLSNINLRKAIAYLIPKDEIISNIYLENGTKANTIINPKSWLFSSEIISYEYDIDMAIQYLKSSGITFSEENKITILVNEENKQRIEAAKIISNRLNNIGIKNEVIKKPFVEYKQLLDNDEFDIFLGGIEFDKVPDYINFLTSSGLDKSSINYSNINDKHMDELVMKVYSSKNEDELLINIEELQEYCNKYLGFVGILFKDYLLLSNKNVKGLKGSKYNYFTNIKEWYITK